MSFPMHGGQGGHHARAAVVRLRCIPGDRLSPRPGETLPPKLPLRRGKSSIWLNALTKAALVFLIPHHLLEEFEAAEKAQAEK